MELLRRKKLIHIIHHYTCTDSLEIVSTKTCSLFLSLLLYGNLPALQSEGHWRMPAKEMTADLDLHILLLQSGQRKEDLVPLRTALVGNVPLLLLCNASCHNVHLLQHQDSLP